MRKTTGQWQKKMAAAMAMALLLTATMAAANESAPVWAAEGWRAMERSGRVLFGDESEAEDAGEYAHLACSQ